MARVFVRSSNVEWVEYSPDTNNLDVEFRGGGTYRYTRVPTHVYQALLSAPSKGKFLNEHVKPHFHCDKLR